MDVVNADEARIAEAAGACAVMVSSAFAPSVPPRRRRRLTHAAATQALERVPSDIRRDGGVARMSDPKMIKEIMEAVSIPVSAPFRRRCPLLLLTLDHTTGHGQVAYRSHRGGSDLAGYRSRLHRRVSSAMRADGKGKELTAVAVSRSEVLTPADPSLHVDKHVSLSQAQC